MSEPTPRSGMSLARRLLIGAALWSLLVLIGGAFLLSAVYRAQTLQLLDEELDGTLRTLTRAVDVSEDGELDYRANALPSDPLYRTPLSGKYWAIVQTDEAGEFIADFRPQSLWDGAVPWSPADASRPLADPGTIYRMGGEGPNAEPLRMAAQAIILDQIDEPVLLVAASDRRAADQSAGRFTLLLVGAMGALAAGVLAAMWGGVRVALRPLARVEADIADIREGRATQLSADYPSEVQPLSLELNKLLDHNRSVVQRAQTHVGNLAHALKTPLAVLRNEAAANETPLAGVVRRQTESMRENVEHYLKRAQAAARAEALGARTETGPVIDGLVRLLNRLFAEKGVDVTRADALSPMFRGEKQDFEEMLGNLMDNACKWASGRVLVTTTMGDAGMFQIDVEDDGPGLTPEERETALKRGVRLDETAPGSGLGLDIVNELAELYAGRLELSSSSLGGLRARLLLPRA
ncbi:MAG: sensor histidine kinase [Pseudomonadota bacterium]